MLIIKYQEKPSDREREEEEEEKRKKEEFGVFGSSKRKLFVRMCFSFFLSSRLIRSYPWENRQGARMNRKLRKSPPPKKKGERERRMKDDG